MAREFENAGDFRLKLALENPEAFFDLVSRFEVGTDLPPNRVRQTHFCLFQGDRMVGSSRLRHHLIPALELDGGHIAYEIRPSDRRKGYGSEILRLTLREATAIGLSRALVTTEPTNLGSIGVILNNGGRFADTCVSPNSGEQLNRYWIELEGLAV